MSQPPPPPNQPPPGQPYDPRQPGGFGPPSGQPPQEAVSGGGFGPPTPPSAPGTPPSAPPLPPAGQPGQPGYGYPQHQQPPSGQQPYGYPQQPPGPSSSGGFGAPAAPGSYGPGAPTPVHGQPGWAPQPGMPGMPPYPGGPQGRSHRSRLFLIIAAVLVLVLAGAGAVVLLSGGDESTSAEGEDQGGGDGDGPGSGGPIEASLAWHTAGPVASAEEIIVGARGSWISGDNLVRTLDNAITAFNLETGAESWSIPLELSSGDCNASPTTSDDRIAVLQGRDCEVLTIIDIAAGEEINSIPMDLTEAGSYFDETVYPAFLGETVAIGWGTGGAGFDATTGEQLWGTSGEEGCPEVAYAVMDEMFVSQRLCGFAGEEGGSIRATNEAGEEQWEWVYGTEYEGKELVVHSVVSLEPLVVTAWLDDEIEQEALLVIDDNHQEISHALDYDIDHYISPCVINTLNDCKVSVVHDGFLYLASSAPGSDNAVVAFELSTGQALYDVPAVYAGDETDTEETFRQIRPFAEVDGKIYAYQRDVWDTANAGMVVAIDPATEEATPVMRLDPGAAGQEAAAGDPSDAQELRLMWHENALLMLTETFYEGDLEDREATLVFR